MPIFSIHDSGLWGSKVTVNILTLVSSLFAFSTGYSLVKNYLHFIQHPAYDLAFGFVKSWTLIKLIHHSKYVLDLNEKILVISNELVLFYYYKISVHKVVK